MPKPPRRWIREVARRNALSTPWTVSLKPYLRLKRKSKAATSGQPTATVNQQLTKQMRQ